LTSEITDVIERRILDIVKRAGKKGILQREIWSKLSIDSRRGHRILKHLEAQGVIERIPITYRGRRTYIVKPTPKLFASIKIPEELAEIPCFFCKLLPRCSSGHMNPLDCDKFSRWLNNLTKAGVSVEVTM